VILGDANEGEIGLKEIGEQRVEAVGIGGLGELGGGEERIANLKFEISDLERRGNRH
jgi:hypothetical protein